MKAKLAATAPATEVTPISVATSVKVASVAARAREASALVSLTNVTCPLVPSDQINKKSLAAVKAVACVKAVEPPASIAVLTAAALA
jgi:hypothetical protein